MPILHDLQEVAPLLGSHGSKSPVVEDQKFDARQALEEPRVMAVAACQRERIEQSWQALIENRSVIPTGLVTERACNPSCRRRSRQRHNAGCPAFEVRIHYPFHPRCGQMVPVTFRRRFAGEDHLVVVQPDGTLALVPSWMAEAVAGSATLTTCPRLSVGRLVELRARLDTLLACSDGLPTQPLDLLDHRLGCRPAQSMGPR